MDEFWVEKAHRYIVEHRAYSSVSEIRCADGGKAAAVAASVSVGLPSLFLAKGVTDKGVRACEPVSFVFTDAFPLRAPSILLRDDFPRGFPHINPNRQEVIPCIYDGELSELLQQSEWMNGILNQLVDWLERAASDSLMDYSQGWEPMRNDDFAGIIAYDLEEATEKLKDSSRLTRDMTYEERDGFIMAGSLCDRKRAAPATLLVCVPDDRKATANYVPNPVTDLGNLYDYAEEAGVVGLRRLVEEQDSIKRSEDKIFVALAIPRPCKVIGSNTHLEFLHFAVNKPRRKGNKKRVVSNAPARMLSHISTVSPELLRRLSGTKANPYEKRPIALIGCGSLGSKIGMSLARHGNEPFVCIDNDLFLPHNNARHALTAKSLLGKAEFLSLHMSAASGVRHNARHVSALRTSYSDCRMVIDASASMSVRSSLMSQDRLPPVVSTGMYDSGTCGILMIESRKRTANLCDLWAHLYRQGLSTEWLQRVLFGQQKGRVAIGQSCSSYTLVVSDAQVSLVAASCSLRIQDVLENGFPDDGEITLLRSSGVGLSAQTLQVPSSLSVPPLVAKPWEIRLSTEVRDRMRMQSQAKGRNETGGVLLGTVFLAAKTVVVTDVLPPPPDSIETATLFVLGTEGLEPQIKRVERQTHGKVTYLGTWHSHPRGGGASGTDCRTAEKLLFVRNYEPTVCMIWTPDGVFAV